MNRIKEYMRKINNMSPAAKASFWFVISNIALKGISFITTPIFTRVLEVADYGATSVFNSWESVISVFASLSLAGGVYNVAMTKFEEDIDKYTSSMMGLTVLSTAVSYGVCLAINWIAPSIFELSNVFLLFMALQSFCNSVTAFWLMRRRFVYDYKKVIGYSLLVSLAGPTFALIAISVFPKTKALAKIVGAGIPGIIIGLIILIYSLSKGKVIFHKKYWKYALRFNIPLLPHYLSSIVLGTTDKLMINSMVGKAEAGIYGIANSISNVSMIVLQAINNSLIPYTLQSIKSKNYKGLSNTISGCCFLVALMCAGITLFAKEGILIIATEEYIGAVMFIAPLSFAILLEFISGIVGNIVFYYEKTAFMSRATMIAALCNVVMNFFGIKYISIIAAGYTTAICSIIKFILYYHGAKKYEKELNKIINLKLIISIFVLYTFAAIYGSIFYNHVIMRLSLIIIAITATVIFRKKLLDLFHRMTNK